MAFSGSQTTRFSMMAMFTRLAGSFAGKEAESGGAPIALARSIGRFVFSRVFGRVN